MSLASTQAEPRRLEIDLRCIDFRTGDACALQAYETVPRVSSSGSATIQSAWINIIPLIGVSSARTRSSSCADLLPHLFVRYSRVNNSCVARNRPCLFPYLCH